MAAEWLDTLTQGLLRSYPLREMFELPVIFDLGEVFFFALSGALAAIRCGYDFVGSCN